MTTDNTNTPTGLLDNTDLEVDVGQRIVVGTPTCTITKAVVQKNERSGTVEAAITYTLEEPAKLYSADASAPPQEVSPGFPVTQRLRIVPGPNEPGNVEIDKEQLGRLLKNVLGLATAKVKITEPLINSLTGKKVVVKLDARLDKDDPTTAYQKFGRVVVVK